MSFNNREPPVWLANLKVGDEVIVERFRGNLRLRKVDHCTRTQIHVGSVKYRRENGRQIGGTNWSPLYLAEATPEKRARAIDSATLERLSNANWDTINPTVRGRICAILDEPTTSPAIGSGGES